MHLDRRTTLSSRAFGVAELASTATRVGCMCRNIRTLHNFEPPATDDEVRSAATQYVRKIAGTTKPSQANSEAFEEAIDDVARITATLLERLVTHAPKRDREVEAAKARARAAERYSRAG
jgi:hypothetical protein